jgi:hypothetical protein
MWWIKKKTYGADTVGTSMLRVLAQNLEDGSKKVCLKILMNQMI